MTSPGEKKPLRAPEAFEISGSGTERPARGVTIRPEPDFIETSAEKTAEAPPERRGSWLGTAFWSALGLLVSLFLVDAIWSMLVSLGQKSVLAGQIGLGLVALIALIALFWLSRELFALSRLGKVERLRQQCRDAILQDDQAAARAASDALVAFYARDPSTAAGRAEIERSFSEIHDPATRVELAERALLRTKDEAARTAIAEAAQRVSVVTAVSPRALVDVLFVLAQSVALVRRLSEIYGGRASGFALLRLLRRIAGHLALTGGMAAADEVMGQVMGAGLAARLSAKLGEGILNGILTARVGLAAVDACRPMEFRAESPIILSQVVKTAVSQ